MPSFENTLAGLQTVGSALDSVKDKASTTMGVLAQTKSAAGEMASSLSKLDQKTAESQAVQQGFRKEIEDARTDLAGLATIYDAVGKRQNAFSQEIQLQIEAIRLGAINLEDFLTMWGDAQIVLEDGVHKIRDLLRGEDFDFYRDKLEALIQDVQSGGEKLAKVLDFLRQSAGLLGKGLIEAVEAFKKGQLTLEALAQLLQRYKKDFQGKPLEALIDSLLQGVLSGELT